MFFPLILLFFFSLVTSKMSSVQRRNLADGICSADIQALKFPSCPTGEGVSLWLDVVLKVYSIRLNPVFLSPPPALWPWWLTTTGLKVRKQWQVLFEHTASFPKRAAPPSWTCTAEGNCPFCGCYSHSSGHHQLAQTSSFMKNLTAFGLNSSLWKNPPVIIFLLNVTTSAGSSRPQCSCAQNFPVQPPPVCTSSTRKAQPCCRDRREEQGVWALLPKTETPPLVST